MRGRALAIGIVDYVDFGFLESKYREAITPFSAIASRNCLRNCGTTVSGFVRLAFR